MKKPPLVYIVVLNWNGIDDTIECLESLNGVRYKNFKTVVVDNGSENNEAERIKKAFPGVGMVKNARNLGFTGGCNKGMEYALKQKADYVLLLNNDTTVEKDFLDKLVNFYEATPDAGLVCPLMLYSDKKTIWYSGVKVQVWSGIVKMQDKGRLKSETKLPNKAYTTDYAVGACVLVSSKLIRKMGMLDEIYFAYYEDTEWGYRTRRYGYESYVVPDATIYHKKSGSTGSGGKKKFSRLPAYYLARNGLIFSSNIEGVKRVPYVVAQYFVKAPLSLILLVSLKAWPSYLRGLLSGTAFLLKSGTHKGER